MGREVYREEYARRRVYKESSIYGMGYPEKGLQRTMETEPREQLILAVKGDQRFHRVKAWPLG